ncbi:MAG: hypothetical protein P1P73_01875, partial [Brevefilum sp.]|nr:hypothetical protein [Brevefilum sp.]
MNTKLSFRTAGLMAYRVLNLLLILMMSVGSPLSVIAQTIDVEGTEPPEAVPEVEQPDPGLEWTEPIPPDAPPGSTITIKGGNSDGAAYLLGETVHVDVVGPNGSESFFEGIDYCDAVVMDDPASEYLIWECDIVLADSPLAVGDYSYTATGLTSGVVETGIFKDAFSVTPQHVNLDPGYSVIFVASGGFEPYSFGLYQDQSGATINATTGEYTAGFSGLGTDIIDIVEVTDDNGNKSYAYVYVGDMGNGETVVDAGCVGDLYGDPTLNCTANDVGLASVTNIIIEDDGCTAPGDTVTFTADYEVMTTATERYDIGLYFSTDGDPNGDGAYTGTCSIATLPYAPDPPWLDLDGTIAGVQDTCGDIGTKAHDNGSVNNPVYHSITLTVECVDHTGDGYLDLPYVVTWSQGADWLCTSPLDAIVGTTSKCSGDAGYDVPIPVPGQIIVDKVTVPSGSSQSFNFSITGSGSYLDPYGDPVEVPVNDTFALTDAAVPWESASLYAGTYTLGETLPTGWDLTSVVCTSDFGDIETYSAIDLDPGETVTCVFTNTQKADVTIVKDTVPDSEQDFDFAFTGGPDTINELFSLDDDIDETLLNSRQFFVKPGTYDIVETPVTNYATNWACTQGGTAWLSGSGGTIDDIVFAAGGTYVCTFTNQFQYGYLTLEKTVVNDNGGTLGAGDFPVYINGELKAWSTEYQLEPGTYTASETVQPGYTASVWGGDCSEGGVVTIAATDHKTCTITNDDQAPSLTLIKSVTNDDSGNSVESEWTLTATGTTGFSGLGPSVSNGASFDAGTYDLSESGPGGYTASDWVCVGGTQDDADTITLGLGESATCTINNDDIAPTLKLVKVVNNNDGGDAVPNDWTLSATAEAPDDGHNFSNLGGSGVFETVYANVAYTLTESTVAGYTEGTWICTGGTLVGNVLTLVEGQTGVTCTITNDDVAPTLKLVKVVNNNDGGDAVPNDWTLSATAEAPDDGHNFS